MKQDEEAGTTANVIETMKLLKITRVDGTVDFVPNNQMTRNLHNDYRSALSKEKQLKYKIELVDLTIQEASDLGVLEAYAKLNPTKKKNTQSSNETLQQLLAATLETNRLMAARLEALETPTEKTKPNKN